MNVQNFLKSAFKGSLSIMGSEPIVISGVTIQAIEDETASSNALGTAAANNERMLVVKFPADAFTGPLKSGIAVAARAQSWQISAEPDSIRKGQIATTITLIEKETTVALVIAPTPAVMCHKWAVPLDAAAI